MQSCRVDLYQDNKRRVVLRTFPAPLRKLGKELMVDFHAMDAYDVPSHPVELNCHV